MESLKYSIDLLKSKLLELEELRDRAKILGKQPFVGVMKDIVNEFFANEIDSLRYAISTLELEDRKNRD